MINGDKRFDQIDRFMGLRFTFLNGRIQEPRLLQETARCRAGPYAPRSAEPPARGCRSAATGIGPGSPCRGHSGCDWHQWGPSAAGPHAPVARPKPGTRVAGLRRVTNPARPKGPPPGRLGPALGPSANRGRRTPGQREVRAARAPPSMPAPQKAPAHKHARPRMHAFM